MVLRLHGEALLQKARPGTQIHECAVHLLASSYVRHTIADLCRLMNYITAVFPTFRLRLLLPGVPSGLSCGSDLQEQNDYRDLLHSEPV
jgi:hypothetical protein